MKNSDSKDSNLILSRRNLLKNTFKGAGLAGVATFLAPTGAIANALCGGTAAQPEGPFYPEAIPSDKDTDLTWVKGKKNRAKGKIIYIRGKVTDQFCKPVESALVEIWQACETGTYNHSKDPNAAPLDPNFQYYGTTRTDKNGMYEFKSIKPGSYPASKTWTRPPHIHYKVHKRGYFELTTQLYFKGEADNSTDLILQDLKSSEQTQVIVDFQKLEKLPKELKDLSGSKFEKASTVGEFNITLKKA